MNRTRPKQIVIRVSEEELEAIKKKVEQSGKYYNMDFGKEELERGFGVNARSIMTLFCF